MAIKKAELRMTQPPRKPTRNSAPTNSSIDSANMERWNSASECVMMISLYRAAQKAIKQHDANRDAYVFESFCPTHVSSPYQPYNPVYPELILKATPLL